MDAQSIAILIAAVCGGLGLIMSGVVMPLLIFMRQSAMEQSALKRDAAIAEVKVDVTKTHDLVNSKMEEQKKLIEKLAYAAGEKAGVAQERANPLTPTIQVPEVEHKV